MRSEYHGATHQLVMHEQTQSGDPLKPHGVPPGYEHPQRLGPDVLDPGGPRILPVSQEVQHGPQRSRGAEFDEAIAEAADLAAWHASVGFKDRRFYGRRFRPTNDVDELEGPQQPYDIKGWQRDQNTHDRLTGF